MTRPENAFDEVAWVALFLADTRDNPALAQDKQWLEKWFANLLEEHGDACATVYGTPS